MSRTRSDAGTIPGPKAGPSLSSPVKRHTPLVEFAPPPPPPGMDQMVTWELIQQSHGSPSPFHP